MATGSVNISVVSELGNITFLCPACQVKLTVPGQLAGVTGPCPYCQTLIQAPLPARQATPPQSKALYTQPSPPPAEAVYVPPEPRQLPSRSEPVEATTRIRAEPSGDRPALGRRDPTPQRQHRGFFKRALVPIAFLGIAAGVVYGVMTFLNMEPSGRFAETPERTESGEAPSLVNQILPDEDDSFEVLTAEGSGQSLTVGDPQMPEIGDVGEETSPNLPPIDAGIEALKVLEKFLEMKSLEERLPHLESKLPEADLANSVLNGPLPEVLNIAVDVRETNSIEQVTDYYYLVDFAGETGRVNPQTMLVRTRGTGAPKVVVDPFLDLFGGRFARFAEKPTEEAGTFQIIISAGAFCYDEVPLPDKKFTLKILAREDTKEIAKAYFGKRSKIGDMLEDETSGLAYGQAKPCTVFMRWNMDEDPQRPFLEALDIKELNWNP